MDPDANLQESREIAARILLQVDLEAEDVPSDVSAEQRQDAVRLAELHQALDEWMEKGGFLPGPWAKGRK